MIDKDRKKSIDDLVNELKSKYDTKSLEGLRQLSKDKEINVIEDDKVIIPCAYLIDKQKYILLTKENSLSKHFAFGHELGHHLIDYLFNQGFGTEKEANYFSKQLTDERRPYFNIFIDCLVKYIKNPFLTTECVLFSDLDNKNDLDIIKRYNSQKEKTI